MKVRSVARVMARDLVKWACAIGAEGLIKKGAEFTLATVWNEDVLNMERNGEARLLRRLSHVLRRDEVLILDVGANRGDWTAIAVQYFPSSTIICFEIVFRTAEKLKTRFGESARVRVVPIGLSDKAGKRRVASFASSDAVSAIDPLPWEPVCSQVMCQVTTGAEFLEAEGIARVDILKVDTEGHDLMVLRGFGPFLEKSPVAVIQFEHGRMAIPSRVLLRDFYDFLSPFGYRIGRLFSHGVRFKRYDFFEDECYRDGNYVAVHESRPEIVNAVSVR